MTAKQYDIIVVGAGMIGLCFAAACAQHFKVAVVEAKAPPLTWDKTQLATRVSALNQASINILSHLGVWDTVDQQTFSPLEQLKVWDSIGGGHIQFNAADIGERQLGVIIENREVVRVLWQQLQEHVDFYIAKANALQLSADGVELTLPDKVLTAKLIVGADGARSWLRQQAAIKLTTRPYQQHAIVATLKTQHAHQCTAWQSFLSTGPLAALPLADQHHVSIVWSVDDDMAEKLMSDPPTVFNCEVMNALDVKLGDMALLSDRISLPLNMRHAAHYSKDRAVLIGDAAHTVHPLAGQGANLGFLDAAALAECLIDAKNKGYDIGGWRPLRRYERWRKGDNQCMLLAMRAFKEVFASDAPWLVQARSLGFNASDCMGFMKNFFMRYAIGKFADLPKLALSLAEDL